VWLIAKDKTIIYTSKLPMFFFGTLGIFLFSIMSGANNSTYFFEVLAAIQNRIVNAETK